MDQKQETMAKSRSNTGANDMVLENSRILEIKTVKPPYIKMSRAIALVFKVTCNIGLISRKNIFAKKANVLQQKPTMSNFKTIKYLYFMV